VLTEANGEALDWPRDADRLADGTTLVSDTRNARLLVVNESGAVLWEKRFDYRTIPYEADRLPGDEAVGRPTYGGDSDDGVARPSSEVSGIPVVTPAHRLLSAVIRLPPWFGDETLASVFASVTLVGAGVVVRLADLRRD
jgi:hypothetical protein